MHGSSPSFALPRPGLIRTCPNPDPRLLVQLVIDTLYTKETVETILEQILTSLEKPVSPPSPLLRDWPSLCDRCWHATPCRYSTYSP